MRKKTTKISNGVDKKLIVILGPTASGKSELAVKLAKRFKGKIISADSRQVYKGMNIGTGKVNPDTKNYSNFSTGQAKNKYIFTHKGIPHYCINVASPKRRFTVAQYRKLAIESINKIFKKGGVPILCGGTGFYIQAVTDGIIIPEVKPDWKLRKKLEKKTVEELFYQLKKLDPERAKTIENKNKRRLIRALEIIIKTKKSVPPFQKEPLPYPVFMIGIKKSPEELKKLIKKRFLKWLRQGLIKEVKNLRKTGLSFKKIGGFGLHYQVVSQYLQNKINYEEMVKNSLKELQNYVKRQMTWFKRHPAPEQVRCGASKRIRWIKNYKEAEELLKKFLKNN